MARRRLKQEQYIDGVLAGDRIILSQAITLIESANPADYELAQAVLAACLPHSGAGERIGITGVPGVGKSTFIENSGKYLIEECGRKLAVLAIDPSSSRSGGSILGDKTRMDYLSQQAAAFVRPSPAAGSLGGVARKTREAIVLCESAGYDLVLVETVGVGQSETAVHSMVDCFLLLMLAGAGDQLQGIKRGIMEMADVLAITKADGPNAVRAKGAQAEYAAALRLLPREEGNYATQVLTCSALDQIGMDRVWQAVLTYCKDRRGDALFEKRRRQQARFWMEQAIEEALLEGFYSHSEVKRARAGMEKAVMEGERSSYAAAKELIALYRNKN